jgi:hypothetical protein
MCLNFLFEDGFVPIKLKVARTEKELDDVFRLRYDVYVRERNKFSEKRSTSDGRIVDHFDALPGVANVVAYDGETAIASFRVNRDSVVGLAPEKYFDFTQARGLIDRSTEEDGASPCIVSGSMLAIHRQWRHKRNVIFSLFKKTTAVMRDFGATHVFGAASAETFSLYGRLGFDAMAEEQWIESVGDKLIPMVAPFNKVFNWAFGKSASADRHFCSFAPGADFETLLLSPGEVLFHQNDVAEHAYLIEKGGISLSRKGSIQDQEDLVASQLDRGALFGEFTYDEQRSVTATATMNTQLLVIKNSYIRQQLAKESTHIAQIQCSEKNRKSPMPMEVFTEWEGLVARRTPVSPEILRQSGVCI